MGKSDLFSFMSVAKTPVSENQCNYPVMPNPHSGLKTMENRHLKDNHLKAALKIFIFLLFTCCIDEMYYKGDMLAMINTARSTGYICQGEKYKPVGKMKWDSQLEKAALIHCNYMDSVGELNHKWKDGTELKDRLLIVGYTSDRASENIARGAINEAEVLENWLNSPQHCEAIMFWGYDVVGVARKGNYWTMVLGYK